MNRLCGELHTKRFVIIEELKTLSWWLLRLVRLFFFKGESEAESITQYPDPNVKEILKGKLENINAQILPGKGAICSIASRSHKLLLV